MKNRDFLLFKDAHDRKMVELAYRTFLRRAHHEEGVATYCREAARHGSIRGVIQSIKASSEYMHALSLAEPRQSTSSVDPHTPVATEATARANTDLENERLKQLSPRARDIYWQLKSKGLSGKPQVNNAVVSPVPNPVTTHPGKGRLIIVSSNCQMEGMTAALQSCLPNDTVMSLPIRQGCDPETEKCIVAELANADIWVCAWDDLWAQDLGPKEKPGFRFIKIPNFQFPAFHPDSCYARRVSDNELFDPHHSSGIGIWAYNKGLTISKAKKLFNRQSYSGLGYFNLWNPSIAAMRSSFASCELDFERFILAVKRHGAFMYTINHPKVWVLIELAKQVSRKIGASEAIFERAIYLNDSLAYEVWPLYPEIADEFSLPHGSYDWKLNNKWLEGIDRYLEYIFEEYAKQQIPRGGLKLAHREEAPYDRVLGPQAGVN